MEAETANTADGPEQGRRPLFALGRMMATPGALAACAEAEVQPLDYFERHAFGDWGDLGPEDREENERSLVHGWRLLSAYGLPNGERLWVITEADRSATTLLTPAEY